MTVSNELSRAGFEGPVLKTEDDRYGFTAIADGLARSICALDENISTVIGIEGRWGSGKSSLMHLLSTQLRARVPKTTQLIPFSPWLNSPDESPVSSLLMTIAARLDKWDNTAKVCPTRLSPLAENILTYAQQTSRRLSPLTRFAGNFMPGVGLIADGMDAIASIDLQRREKTTSELREIIESKISALGVSFIVIIDDLDRLEPDQAVEILRMVRSVADFSRFRYVMCYDRDVLAHAVERGLGVQDGALYLQKVIPLSFSLPRPENFDLRREFRQGALALWREINGSEPDDKLIRVLAQYTGIYGEALSSPREVNQVLNAVRFRYPGLRDYVYFPDLCLIQLLVTVNPALASWVEHYLTDWSIVVMHDGHVSDGERLLLTEKLIQAINQFGAIPARSVWELHDWLPGIDGIDEKTLRLFVPAPENSQEQSDSLRRLSSPVYWRYYFSFSAPQNVLSDAEIREILSLASSDYAALEERLLNSVTANGVSSRTWFEHILARLTPAMTLSAGYRAQKNLLRFFFHCSDAIFPIYRDRNLFFRPEELDINALVSQLIKQLQQKQPVLATSYLSRLFYDARSFSWATTYLRFLAQQGDGEPVSREEVSNLRLIMKIRFADKSIQQAMAEIPFLTSFLYACKDMVSKEEICTWIVGEHLSDRAFLQILLNLRSPVSSSNLGTYQRLDLDSLQAVFGIAGIESRLENIKFAGEDALKGMVAEIENAIRLNKM